jgi:hypothetical protein
MAGVRSADDARITPTVYESELPAQAAVLSVNTEEKENPLFTISYEVNSAEDAQIVPIGHEPDPHPSSATVSGNDFEAKEAPCVTTGYELNSAEDAQIVRTVYQSDLPASCTPISGNASETKEITPIITSYEVSSIEEAHIIPTVYETDPPVSVSRNIYESKDVPPNVQPSYVSKQRNVLEDMPLNPSVSVEKDGEFDESLERMWQGAEGILKELQHHIGNFFGGSVKIDDMKVVLGKLIVQGQTRKTGSRLTYDFLDASRKKKYSLISQIFESFVDQGERFARVIVTERRLPPSSRLIADAKIGGVAGGSKYIARYQSHFVYLF